MPLLFAYGQNRFSHDMAEIKIQTSKEIAVIIVKFEQCGFINSNASKRCMQKANSVDPDHTAPSGIN